MTNWYRNIVNLMESSGNYQTIKFDEEHGSVEGWVTNVDADYLEDWLGALSQDGLAEKLTKYDRIAFLDTIHVEEELRLGGGWGKYLVKEFTDAAKRYGAKAILVHADGHAEPIEGFDLVRWYEGRGFSVVSQEGEGYAIMIMPLEAQKETMTEYTSTDLAGRIFSFLDRHAGISPNYDPDYDAPEDRFTGPDASLLNAAAENLREGRPVHWVDSSWGSGTYKPYDDKAARAEHDALVKEVNALVKR